MFKISVFKGSELIGSTIENKEDAKRLLETLNNLYTEQGYEVTCEQV